MSEPTGKRILVVDDEKTVSDLLSLQLINQGYATKTAKNGMEALELLEKDGLVDLLIIDVQMPVMNGFETLATMQEKGWDSVPTIMLTAKEKEDDKIVRGYKVGADHYVLKPFSTRKLIKLVDSILATAKEPS